MFVELPPTDQGPSQARLVESLLQRRPCQVIISTSPSAQAGVGPAARETRKLPDHYTGSIQENN